ncbi:TldD/PmbA family protein [Candidatus Woesearchaeota archaeon]|nr:TldD/PmbA family protein [Candidatus Woesearchaeota archaeon]
MALFKFLEKEDKVKYWDFRHTTLDSTSINLSGETVKDIDNGSVKQYSIRVLYGNAWGFTSFDNLDKMEENVIKALKIAKAMSKKTEREIIMAQIKPIKDFKKTRMRVDPVNISLSEKKNLILEGSIKALDFDRKIKSSDLYYTEKNLYSEFANSEGSFIQQRLNYIDAGIFIVASDGMRTVDSHDGIARLGGFEVLRGYPEAIQKCCDRALELLTAKSPKTQNANVVIDGALAGLFIHEALGHSIEADHVIKKDSILANKINKKLGTEILNVYDDPSIEGGFGSYFYDDEGVPSQKTKVISNGVLRNFLHSRETAAILCESPTGNGRAEEAGFFPIPRMSNMYIGKKDYTDEELIEDLKNGIFVLGQKGGQVNSAEGTFEFGAKQGYLVKNGEITGPLRELSFSGNLMKILKSIKAIGNSYEESDPGYCQKLGQIIPVDGANPKMLIKNARIIGKNEA